MQAEVTNQLCRVAGGKCGDFNRERNLGILKTVFPFLLPRGILLGEGRASGSLCPGHSENLEPESV